MKIKKVGKNDYQDYYQTYTNALREGFTNFVPNNWLNNFDNEFEEYFLAETQKTFVEMYITYLDNEPIGVFSIDKYNEYENCAILDSIYFRKSQHGKGYAKTALDFIEKRIEDLGYKKVVLWCSTENTRAWKFYTKNNYKPTDKKWDDILDGVTFHNILLEKEI